MSQTFERTVDRKDAIIRSLAMDIEEAEEQYQVALRKHLQNMDDLIGEGLEGGEEREGRERERERERTIPIISTIQLSKPSVLKTWKMNTSKS